MNRDVEADCRIFMMMALTPDDPPNHNWIDVFAKTFDVSRDKARHMLYQCMVLKHWSGLKGE